MSLGLAVIKAWAHYSKNPSWLLPLGGLSFSEHFRSDARANQTFNSVSAFPARSYVPRRQGLGLIVSLSPP